MDDYQQSIVAEWNEVALDAIRSGSAKPTATIHQIQSLHTAMYDAWAATDENALGVHSRLWIPQDIATESFKAEAISYAAFNVLSEMLPERIDAYRTFMIDHGYDPDRVAGPQNLAQTVGEKAAQGLLDYCETDFSNFVNGYADTSGYQPANSADPDATNSPGHIDFDPNSWQPLRVPTGAVVDENGTPIATEDPASYTDQLALTPHFGTVKSFSMTWNDEFLPQAPPELGNFSEYIDATGKVTTSDAAYREQFGALVDISAGLTPEQKAIAEYWADGPRTESPPGHWNQIAQDLAKRDGHDIDQDVVMFFALNNALFDAAISTWNTKYEFDGVRPQSAIRNLFYDQEIQSYAGPNLGSQTILGQEWQPYQNVTFVTPPFPEYVSGHSTFSAAAAEILTLFTGTNAYYDGTTLGNYDLNDDGEVDRLGEYTVLKLDFENYEGEPIVLRWNTLQEAADEAGLSRLYGGIHMQDGDLFGRMAGTEIGQSAWESSLQYVQGTSGGLLRGVSGSSQADLLIGSQADDTLLALDGNDQIRGSLGSDLIDGGKGVDTVFYQHTRSEIMQELTAQGQLTVSKSGGGVDTLLDVERVELLDGRYVFDIDSDNLGFGYRVYKAAFDRTPDEAGVRYWVEVLDSMDVNGYSLAEKQRSIADAFCNSQEFRDIYGENPSNAEFVEAMYLNVTHRLPDQPGQDFWVDSMDAGLSQMEVLVLFTESIENQSNNAPNLDDGVWLV